MSHVFLYAIWFGVALVFLVGLLSIIHSLVVAHRLHSLSREVAAHGLDTFQHVQLMTCEACYSKRHVHVYRYGSDTAMKTVALCYLCVPRLERTLEGVSPVSSSPHSGTSSHSIHHARTVRSHGQEGY